MPFAVLLLRLRLSFASSLYTRVRAMFFCTPTLRVYCFQAFYVLVHCQSCVVIPKAVSYLLGLFLLDTLPRRLVQLQG